MMDVSSIDHARHLCLDIDSCSSAHVVVESESCVAEWWGSLAGMLPRFKLLTDSRVYVLRVVVMLNENVPASVS